MPKVDYETDYYLWLETTLSQLRAHSFQQVDWEHLIEEVEGLARAERNQLERCLTILLVHLLCLHYWIPEEERRQNARG